ncbi:MAG: hydantoinase/oxoprolinase family protein [Caldilineaceae bacterium]|nr:hydantoinase/oxoprolinase family protein [Caldilineaceae bacterium]
MPTTLVGTDVGGTFTDFVLLQDGRLQVHKEATTPADQSQAILAGLTHLGITASTSAEATADAELVHGTTIATNALLERRGARTALLTTAGFVDVIEIGRQNRPHLYDLHQVRHDPLTPPDLRFEAVERLDKDGNVLTALDEAALARTAEQLASTAPESLAICLLYSFRNPRHEQLAADILRRSLPQLPISLSSDILPEYREYERTATTVINAYLLPLVGRYLQRLTAKLVDLPIRVMQSNGGAIGTTQAAREPARLVLSGPAGGVVGAFRLAQLADEEDSPRIITFDMGGTSTDVALCPGIVPRTAESEVAGLPLRLPVIDIHTVGAGGGSVARVDAGGGLRVGPESAGAEPGPVCYARGGDQPTVTDANLVLGRLDAGQFLGGSKAMRLDVAAAESALAALGAGLGGLSVHEAALGVIRVANARMERALRRVSVERGYDPRTFTLVPFGGAGPLHACDLADALGIPRILLPPSPGVLSALGLLIADVVHESSQALLIEAASLAQDPAPLQELSATLEERVRSVLAAEGVDAPALESSMDLRYRGQSYELSVPLDLPASTAAQASQAVQRAIETFHAAHDARYGYAMPTETVESVAVRLRGSGSGEELSLTREPLGPPDPESAQVASKPVWFGPNGAAETPCYDRLRLRPGHRLQGPAIVFQFDTTTVVAPGWSANVDERHNLLLARAGT